MGNKSVATSISKDEFDPEKCQKKIFAPLPAVLLAGLLTQLSRMKTRPFCFHSIYPLSNDISEVRFWCDDNLIDIQRVKNRDLKGVHF